MRKVTLLAFFAIMQISIGWARELCLVKIDAKSESEFYQKIDLIESHGLAAAHIFPPDMVVFDRMRTTSDDHVELVSGSTVLKPGNSNIKANSARLQQVQEVFDHLIFGDTILAVDAPATIPNCLREIVDAGQGLQQSATGISTSAVNRFTGQYLIGRIAVGIYLMESNGPNENWYPQAEQTTLNEIVQGLDWLAQEGAKRGSKVVWVYAPVEKVFTDHEPIERRSMPFYNFPFWVFNWLDDIFRAHGQPTGWDGAYGLANQLRSQYRTNWAVEISVVMDDNDTDHMFTDGTFAYVTDYVEYQFPCCSYSARVPLVTMTYNNERWGPGRMNFVAAHEVSHVFGTSDEYAGVSTCENSASCGLQRAYLTAPPAVNGNCAACNPSPQVCYMRGVDTYSVCDFTPAELGWRDHWIVNEVPDPVDENSGTYMWIQPVAAGDRLTIVTLGGQLMNVIAVTDDMLFGANRNIVHWDGVTHKDELAPWGLYPVSKNGQDLGTFYLNFMTSPPGTISSHYFRLDTVSYLNQTDYLFIRNTIYDSLGQIYSRPRFDIATNSQTTVKSYIYGYQDGIYTSKVFGFRSDGASSNLSTLRFMNYICGDVSNDGTVDIADIDALIDFLYIFFTPPPHMTSADVYKDHDIDIADLTVLIDYLYLQGPPLECWHHL